MDWLKTALDYTKEIVAIIVAIVPILTAIRSNRKKTQDSIKEVQDTLKTHIKEDEDEKARSMRYRILRFYDEMCEGKRHSESHFEDILEDCDNYEKYCDSHPNFKNSRGHVAIAYIKESYQIIKSQGGFLTHKEGTT